MYSSPAPALRPLDRRLAFALFAAALGLRLPYASHFRIDSDEPQHLHVVWAWTQGLLPYRDVFDNHTPVFQALCAPLFHALGVRADILVPMRLAMLPIFGITIWCVWKCARTLFTPRAALWTAVLATFCPPFFFTSLEFRPDELWTLAWLLTLTVLVTGRFTTARLFAAGLLLGFSFSVSMKTSLLLGGLASSAGFTLLLQRRAGGLPVEWPRLAKGAGAAVLGMLVVPALVALFFVTHGAGPKMYYCVIQHNVLPGANGTGRIFRCTWRWLLSALPIIAAGALMVRLPAAPATRQRIAFTFFAAAIYFTSLVCFWPILTPEDYLPFYPAIMITVGPGLLWLADLAGRWLRLPSAVLPALLAVGEIAIIIRTTPPTTNCAADKIGMVGDALKLTDPDDFVMDSKGETIYRRRPFYYVLEGLTKQRLDRGLITDDVAERLIATRTPLATMRRMPAAGKSFIKANYVPIAFRLSVAGKTLRTEADGTRPECHFEIAIPLRYTLVSASGSISSMLDGTPFDGPRDLAAGRHEFVQSGHSEGRIVLVWAQAVDRGYSPFAKIKTDTFIDHD